MYGPHGILTSRVFRGGRQIGSVRLQSFLSGFSELPIVCLGRHAADDPIVKRREERGFRKPTGAFSARVGEVHDGKFTRRLRAGKFKKHIVTILTERDSASGDAEKAMLGGALFRMVLMGFPLLPGARCRSEIRDSEILRFALNDTFWRG